MFDVGFSELVVIGLIALIVLGPKRLPEVARTAGRWAGRLRRFVADVKQDLDKEMHHAELSELRKLKQELDDTRRLMENTSGQLIHGFTEVDANSVASSSTQPTENHIGQLPKPAAKRARRSTKKKSPSVKKNGGKRQQPPSA